MLKTDDSAVFFFANILTAMVYSVSLFLSSSSLPSHSMAEEPLMSTGGTDTQKKLAFTWKRAMGFIFSTLLFVLVACVILVDMRYAQWVTLFLCLFGGLCFGCFIVYKAQSLLNARARQHELCKEDAVIGCISLIYVDFGFVLLLFLFVMLGMIKALTHN